MAQDEKETKNIPAINRCLSNITKNIEKLQSLGVLANFTYCLPPTGTMYTRGSWGTIAEMIASTVSNSDYANFNKKVQEDLADLNDSPETQGPLPLLGALPDPEKASRDDLRPILTELVRISQAKGHACKRIMYSKNGEKVDPPSWWPGHVKFEGISSVMTVDDIRAAYEAGKLHFAKVVRDKARNNNPSTVTEDIPQAEDSAATPPQPHVHNSPTSSDSSAEAPPSISIEVPLLELEESTDAIPLALNSPFVSFLNRSTNLQDKNARIKGRQKNREELMLRLQGAGPYEEVITTMVTPTKTDNQSRPNKRKQLIEIQSPCIAVRKSRRTRLNVNKYSK